MRLLARLDQGKGLILILHPGARHLHDQEVALRIDQHVALAPLHLLGEVKALQPPFSVVFTDWLSMMAAEGWGSRPARRRAWWTRWASIWCQRSCCCHR